MPSIVLKGLGLDLNSKLRLTVRGPACLYRTCSPFGGGGGIWRDERGGLATPLWGSPSVEHGGPRAGGMQWRVTKEKGSLIGGLGAVMNA